MSRRDTFTRTLMFYINTIGGGGAERVITQVANYLSDRGYHVIMVTSFAKENEYPLAAGIKRINLEEPNLKQSRLKKNISRICALRRACVTCRPDVLISFMAEANFRNLFATAGLAVKSIISVRNDPEREYSGKAYCFLARYILPHADGCVFQTEEARAWFPQKLQRKSTILYNAVDLMFYAISRELGDAVVTLGRLCEQKNHAMLIRAFAEVAPHYPEVQLHIYGEGALEGALRQLISELDLEARVCLMRPTKHPDEVLSKARAFVLSSDYEGMPNALMEAMAVGVPCISTDCPCGGPRELLNDGDSGLLVPVGDCKRMAQALDRLLANRATAEQLGKNARERAEIFKRDVVLAQWEDYIGQICKS